VFREKIERMNKSIEKQGAEHVADAQSASFADLSLPITMRWCAIERKRVTVNWGSRVDLRGTKYQVYRAAEAILDELSAWTDRLG
jgi:hypothetical protein